MSFVKHLPPLNALKTFEAAARHLSFKRAAEELFVTQAAVSRQIQVLEEFYGLKLFERRNRQVVLTPEGRALYDAASSAFLSLSTASHTLLNSTATDYLSLSTTGGFAQLWLMPRLGALRQACPELKLQLVSSESNPDYRERFQAAITLGLEDHAHYVATYLFSEEIFPVCSPDFLARHPGISGLAALSQVPLLDLDAQHWGARLWEPMDWAYWFKQFGVAPTGNTQSMSFSHFSVLLDAVLQGQGVGLAWRHLVQHQLDTGVLVRPLPERLLAHDRKHYFVYNRDPAMEPRMLCMRDWLLAQTEYLRRDDPR
ncbi:Glycine cleavage system transcriptional activator [Pseudomonas reidholzensis]|uniref:Glycine cleavage system transcriptional activator n=1 Tax=Pseudomonas reidholzensis TaxID=1785162 RepID=A0A383RU26_9PSED|nr:LysR substrate-binding domain-containing protein [Pseudomonas reidholzensis]SYX90567.1 Glycine cleavage system transcriptional activator [Pseudomonas reidholzensis]